MEKKIHFLFVHFSMEIRLRRRASRKAIFGEKEKREKKERPDLEKEAG